MGHSIFLNSTCDIVENKLQGHATLPFLKIDMRHWGRPIKGLIGGPCQDRPGEVGLSTVGHCGIILLVLARDKLTVTPQKRGRSTLRDSGTPLRFLRMALDP